MADQLADGRRFRALTIMDVFTRESLAIAVGQRLKGEEVVATLNDIRLQRGVPKFLFCDGTLRSECLDVHWFATFTGGQASHRRLEAGIQ